MAEAAQGRIVGIGRIDRRADRSQFFRARRAEQHAQPVAQERAVARRIGQRERVEARRLAVAKREIGPAAGPHEDFRAAILVDEDLLGAESLQLRQHEVLNDGLARA